MQTRIICQGHLKKIYNTSILLQGRRKQLNFGSISTAYISSNARSQKRIDKSFGTQLRGGGSRWAGRAYAHWQNRRRRATRQWRLAVLLLAHSDFQTLRHPCNLLSGPMSTLSTCFRRPYISHTNCTYRKRQDLMS